MTVAALIGAAAGLVQAASYLIYVAQMLRRDCRPNGMSWVMWSYGGLVVVAMQAHLGAPWTVVAVPAVGLACSVAIAVVAFSRCDRLRPDRQDWTALGIDAMLTAGYVAAVAAGALSRAFGAVVALVGLCALTSAWPALRSTFANPRNERPLAWFVGAGSHGLMALATLAEGLAWPFLVYPALSLATELAVGLLALRAGGSAGPRPAAPARTATAARRKGEKRRVVSRLPRAAAAVRRHAIRD